MCDSSQRELQNEERRELGLEPWKVQSRQSRKGLEGGTDLYSFCHSCMNYSWASSEVILKSYSEMREQTAWSAEF